MKTSIYFNREMEMLIPYVKKDGENISQMVQRLITEEAARRGYRIETKVTKENDA